MTHLPRGGVYVQTKHGNIQFGMPPETIKDSLNLGLEVPSIFVPPKDRFNLKCAATTLHTRLRTPVDQRLHQRLQPCAPVCASVHQRLRRDPNPNPDPDPNPNPNPNQVRHQLLRDRVPRLLELLREGTHEHRGDVGRRRRGVTEGRRRGARGPRLAARLGPDPNLNPNRNRNPNPNPNPGQVLEGPASEHLFTDEEYGPGVSAETFAARPDHEKEIDFFKEPRGGRVISTDTLVRFVIFQPNADGHMQADLPCEADGGTLAVVDDGSTYHVLVDGNEVATVDDFLASAITDPPHILIPSRTQKEQPAPSALPADSTLPASSAPPADPAAPVDPAAPASSAVVGAHANEFDMPEFGITVLGSADGFTKDGTTAGFVLWMRGRGILVDPPAHSAHYLRENGIASRKITHVILTHCHADHDAGTFQKILLEGRVTVMTTKTIMAQFIRKYSLISGLTDDFLFRLFVFLPVRIGEPAHFQGGTLSFFYAFHALPCVGARAPRSRPSGRSTSMRTLRAGGLSPSLLPTHIYIYHQASAPSLTASRSPTPPTPSMTLRGCWSCRSGASSARPVGNGCCTVDPCRRENCR